MISKLFAGKTYISNRKLIILGSLQGELDALFGLYQECFNTFSTLILIFIDEAHYFYNLISTDTHSNDHVHDLILA